MLSVSQIDNGPYMVEGHTFTDPAALRTFVEAYQALAATFPSAVFTLNDDGSIATWQGANRPADVSAVVATWRTAQDKQAVDAAALRTRVVSLAQSAVGTQIDALTPAQTRALLALLLYKAGAIDTTGAVLSLAGWL